MSISTISMNASRSRSRECRHLPHLTCPLRARCIPFGTAHKVSKLSPRIKLSGHARASKATRATAPKSLRRLANLECDLNDTAEAFLTLCILVVSCLALHHHQGTGTTPALVVMIATHDNVLIAQSAGSVGTNKQRQLHHKMNRAMSRDRRCTHSSCAGGYVHILQTRPRVAYLRFAFRNVRNAFLSQPTNIEDKRAQISRTCSKFKGGTRAETSRTRFWDACCEPIVGLPHSPKRALTNAHNRAPIRPH